MLAELEAAAIQSGIYAGDPLDIWDVNPAIRERVRPVVVDEAKGEQFLAAKRMALDAASRTMFLDYLTRDFFAAITLLARRARGDYGSDKHAEQFPRSGSDAPADASLTPWKLFERWVAKAKPAISTVDRWRGVFLKLTADLPNTSAGALLPEQAQTWANGLISEERTEQTVMDTYVRACRTVFNWALQEKLISRNAFVGWRIKVPKKTSNRETQAFTTEESTTILSAALKITGPGKLTAAKRPDASHGMRQ